MSAIIFDCDGTLVDSETLSTEVLVEAAAEHGLEMTVPEALAAFRGGKMADCIADLEMRLGRTLPETFVPDFRARSAEAFRLRLRAIDGALAAVRSLSALSVPICVASSGPMAKIELSLSLTGLLPFFEGRVFSSYDVGVWKPRPGLFLHAAAALGVAPADCAVVEDSLPGMQAGLAAGMTVFAFQPHGVDPRTPSGTRPLANLMDLHHVSRCQPHEQMNGSEAAFASRRMPRRVEPDAGYGISSRGQTSTTP